MRGYIIAALLVIALACTAGGALGIYGGRLVCGLLFVPAAAAVFGAMVYDYNTRWGPKP